MKHKDIIWKEGKYNTYYGYVGDVQLFKIYYIDSTIRIGNDKNKPYNLYCNVIDKEIGFESVAIAKRKAKIMLKRIINIFVDHDEIYNDIEQECNRQFKIFGEQNHDKYKWLAILGEEVGECNKAVLEDNDREYYNEMIQVAAVIVTALKCRNKEKVNV